jgi:D-alanyl-D-alanine carboxypeptidase
MLVSSATRRRRSMRLSALAVVVAVVVGACGSAADVPVPGAAPTSTIGDTGSDRAVFVEVRTTDDSDAPATSPGRVELGDPTPSTISPTADTVASVSTVVSEIVEAGSDAVIDALPTTIPVVAPVPVVPVVSGWPAFDQHLMTILDDGSSAVSATVLRNGEVVHEVAIGERTSAGDPVEIGDRYRIASISKLITSITMLQLVEAGAIGIDDVVGPRLAALVGVTSPSAGVESITVRHLLTHRSGIAQYENLMFRRQVESCAEAGATGLSRGLERTPGTTYRYSNLNFCLLGLLIEDVTGDDYEAVVDRELLDPLGIDGMRLAGTFDVGEGDVEHDSDDGRNYMEVLDAAGSWIASPTDIARITDSLDLTTPGWKPLGPAAHAEMMTVTVDPPIPPEPVTDPGTTTTTTTIVPPPPTRGYGMGLMIFGSGSFGHTGTLESTSAMTVRQPDGLTWAITVSGDSPGSGRNLAPIVAEAFRYAGDV